MERVSVLALLRAYAGEASCSSQAESAAAIVAFAEAHPDCLSRTCIPGHLTGSAWIVDKARTRTLLTHHRKLGKWLQLGGHADGDPDLPAVALREAREESGLAGLQLVFPRIFDVDIHEIPARPGEPAHLHYDLRFLIEADPLEPLVVSAESKALVWIELASLAELTSEESVLRMARKSGPSSDGKP